VDVGGDAREAEAFGAQFEEMVFRIVRMHGTSFRIVGAKRQTLQWLYWLYWLFFHRECGLVVPDDGVASAGVRRPQESASRVSAVFKARRLGASAGH
jgi:hypothetical protein